MYVVHIVAPPNVVVIVVAVAVGALIRNNLQ